MIDPEDEPIDTTGEPDDEPIDGRVEPTEEDAGMDDDPPGGEG